MPGIMGNVREFFRAKESLKQRKQAFDIPTSISFFPSSLYLDSKSGKNGCRTSSPSSHDKGTQISCVCSTRLHHRLPSPCTSLLCQVQPQTTRIFPSRQRQTLPLVRQDSGDATQRSRIRCTDATRQPLLFLPLFVASFGEELYV